MSNHPIPPEPKLAAPGAGLPWLELQVARQLFQWQFRRCDQVSAAALIRTEQVSILQLARSCPEGCGGHRVLIKRLPGLEDSSRYWSVFMTLDHLRIVNGFIADTLSLLGRGEVPERAARTAAVKPDPQADAVALVGLETSCDAIARTVDAIPDLRTTDRFAHPWFGPLDAAAWHFMAGFHMRLHRRQIQAILRGLDNPGRGGQKGGLLSGKTSQL